MNGEKTSLLRPRLDISECKLVRIDQGNGAADSFLWARARDWIEFLLYVIYSQVSRHDREAQGKDLSVGVSKIIYCDGKAADNSITSESE